MRSGAFGALLALMLLSGCSRDAEIHGAGTIEIDEIDVASQAGGRLIRLAVTEGDSVTAGDTLAVLDRGELTAELAVQLANAERAQAQARDLQAGARPAEVLKARADLAAAEAELEWARLEAQRAKTLLEQQAIAQAVLDRAISVRATAEARVRAASEELRLREQGFRRLQVSAASDAATAAMAQVAGARSRASELVLLAPSDGIVLLRNFDVGELVPAGLPVVTLGDPDRLWMRLFIGAPLLTRFQVGDPVEVTPVGSRQHYPGHIVHIANKAEFTPRAALTEEEQANLVFAVKVSLDPSSGTLKAGLPASARIRPAAPRP